MSYRTVMLTMILFLAVVGISFEEDHHNVIARKNIEDTQGSKVTAARQGINYHRLILTQTERSVQPAALVSASRLKVDRIYDNQAYRNPTGEGINVAVTDLWTVQEDHPELAGRVTVMHDPSGLPTPTVHEYHHGTSCAGLIAATGIDPAVKGMAPLSSIVSLVAEYDPVNELAYAAETYGIVVSENAWVMNEDYHSYPVRRMPMSTENRGARPSGLNSDWGFYLQYNNDLDTMIREKNLLQIFAAGNDGYMTGVFTTPDSMGQMREPDLWHKTYPGYDNSGAENSSKNVLTIGATHKDDVIAQFSACGPVAGGRIAPQLVAPGTNIRLIANDGYYATGWGTSNSSPLTAGVATLLQHQYQNIHGVAPGGDLLKAILINSARDLGPKGPDFQHGFGLVDAELAAMTISGQESVGENRNVVSKIIETEISNKQKLEYTFNVPRKAKELRITLVWNDPSGKYLVNNLDVYARFGKEKKILPLTLDPNNPTALAKNKKNRLDNVEHIVVEKPKKGEWNIVVSGKKVPQGPQRFVMVVSTHKKVDIPVIHTEGAFQIEDAYVSKADVNVRETRFSRGDPVSINVWLSVSQNAYYTLGGYYGTVSGIFEIRNQSGDFIFYLKHSSETVAPTGDGEYFNFNWHLDQIPPNVPTGTYNIRATIFMHNGLTRTIDFADQFTIE